MMRAIFLFLILWPLSLQAQQAEPARQPMNQTNKQGQREGLWLIRQPERMGEDAYSEFGNYIKGLKYGAWYRLNALSELQAIEHFKKNVLDGEVKYFEQGHLVCIGNYLGLNPGQDYDTIFVMDPITHAEKLTVIPTDRGTLRHGTWRYYDPESGRLIREEEWSADQLITRKEFTISRFDSAYYQQRIRQMPHNRKKIYQPPRGKRSITE